jgi:hypothetical protein
MLAQVYTTWRPDAAPMSADEHRASLEARWGAGVMNVKQMYEAMGGAISLAGAVGSSLTGANLPGVGPFPGAA